MDGRMLGGGGTGVAHYAAALAAAQAELSADSWILTDESHGADRIGRWAAALGGRARRTVATRSADGRKILVGRHIFKAAHGHFGLYGRLLRVRMPGPPGIMHWSYPVPIRIEGWRNVYTVHDVIPIDHPELSPVSGRRLAAVLRRILMVADRIVTVSEHARERIIARTGCAPDRVVNCYQPVARPAATDRHWPYPFARGRYHLVCGSVEARKNVARIIAAHAASGATRPLVIAGPDGNDAAAMMAGAGTSVIRLAYQSDAAMAALQAETRALLMPSLAEGFGLPVVEAMAARTPVLTSWDGALAEVAGGAALLVDPHDVDAIARGIALLDRDDALCADLADRGLARAAAFEAHGFATRLRAVYAQPKSPTGSVATPPSLPITVRKTLS